MEFLISMAREGRFNGWRFAIYSVTALVPLTIFTAWRLTDQTGMLIFEHTKPLPIGLLTNQPSQKLEARSITNFPDGAEGIFGTRNVAERQLANPAMLPETTLNVKLTGVFISPDENRSSALLRLNSGDVSRLQIGQSLTEGITVHSITKSLVVLSVNGQLENVFLNRE